MARLHRVCGDVTAFGEPVGCDCHVYYRVLDGVAEKLEFKLTMAERHDEAEAVRKAAAR